MKTRKCAMCGAVIVLTTGRKKFCISCANQNNRQYAEKAKKPREKIDMRPLWVWMPKYLHEWNLELMDGVKNHRARKWRIKYAVKRRLKKSVESS